MDDQMRVVKRAIDILFALRGGSKTAPELMAATGLSKPTLYRFLHSLQYQELVVAEEGSRWALGGGVLALAGSATGPRLRLLDAIRDELEAIWQATGETTVVHVRQGLQRVCIEELESLHPIHYSAGLGAVAPIHVGSAGKALLAFLPDAELAPILAAIHYDRITDRTISSREALQAELEQVRRQGYSLSAGERIPGAAAISVPLIDHRRRAVAAVSVLGPDNRLTPEKRLEYQPQMLAAAQRMSVRLRPPSGLSPGRAGARSETTDE